MPFAYSLEVYDEAGYILAAVSLPNDYRKCQAFGAVTTVVRSGQAHCYAVLDPDYVAIEVGPIRQGKIIVPGKGLTFRHVKLKRGETISVDMISADYPDGECN